MGFMINHRLFFCKGLGILQPTQAPPLQETDMTPTIPGTTPFDGPMAQKGYALNKMCFSFNDKVNRDAFVADPEGYMQRYGLNDTQAAAIRSKQVLQLLEAGGNAYYLAKFAGIFGLDMQDIGAQQTGMSKEAFRAKLVAANHQPV
jgi:protocatechuate 4,5-dioxygenase, alpha chain